MSTIGLKNKIALFNELYEEIAGHGRNGDTELAHINKYEAAVLKAMGGSATVNTVTGLREYWDDDDPAPAPAPAGSTTVTQVSDLPEYFKPYVEELFATAQDVYEKPYVPYGHELVEGEDAEGNVTYDVQKMPDIIDPVTGIASPAGKRLADVTEEQATAFGGLRDLFTQVDPTTGQRSFRDPTAAGFEEAKRLAARGARGFDELAERDPVTGEIITSAAESFKTKYMGPYSGAVTEIQIREQEKAQELQRQQRQQAARMASALGGSRYGIETALAGNLDAQLLDDIRKKGLESAYTQGLETFQADRDAAARGAGQRSAMTAEKFGQQLKGLGALQSTGETQRAIAQQPLDIGYEEFARQQKFPRTNLQELSGILRGFQVQPTTYQTSQTYKQPPSLGQQLLAAGTLGAGISKGLGSSLLGKSARGGGLMSVVPERYAKGDTVPTLKRMLQGLGLSKQDLIELMSQEQGLGYVTDRFPDDEVDSRPSSVRRPPPGARQRRLEKLPGQKKSPSTTDEIRGWGGLGGLPSMDEIIEWFGSEKKKPQRGPSRGRSIRDVAKQRLLKGGPRPVAPLDLIYDESITEEAVNVPFNVPSSGKIQMYKKPPPWSRHRAAPVRSSDKQNGLAAIYDEPVPPPSSAEDDAVRDRVLNTRSLQYWAAYGTSEEKRIAQKAMGKGGPYVDRKAIEALKDAFTPIPVDPEDVRPRHPKDVRATVDEHFTHPGPYEAIGIGKDWKVDEHLTHPGPLADRGRDYEGDLYRGQYDPEDFPMGDEYIKTDFDEIIEEVSPSTKADAKKGDGTLFDWDQFAPYAAAYLELQGTPEGAEGLRKLDPTGDMLKKAQMEYYKGLGAKARDWAKDAARKGTLANLKLRVKTSMDATKAELASLQGKEGTAQWTDMSEENKARVKKLRERLDSLNTIWGAFGTVSESNPATAILERDQLGIPVK